MRKTSRPNRTIIFLLALLAALSLSANAALAEQCDEHPSCQVVGSSHVLAWQSSAPSDITVVCVHGLGLCASAYQPLAEEFCKAGINGYAINVRGFGPDRTADGRSKVDCVQTISDLADLLKEIRTNNPRAKLYLIGESMGGAIVIRAAAQHPELVDGIICSAPAWKVVKKPIAVLHAVRDFARVSRSEPGPLVRSVVRQATSDHALSVHLLTDPAHRLNLSWGEARTFLRFIAKTDDFARTIQSPTLLVQGTQDNLIMPKGAARLFRQIPSGDKTLLLDGQAEHLALQEAKPNDVLLTKLINWIRWRAEAPITTVQVEVINDNTVSPAQRRRIERLVQRARGIKI
jgi:acylglycerol lipase